MFRLRNTRPLTARACGVGLTGVAVVVAVCALCASSAIAAPPGEYAAFAQCPVHAAQVDACLAFHIESGELKIGNEQVPLPQALQGGLLENEPSFVKPMAGALNGETLARPAQKSSSGPVSAVWRA